MESQDCRNGDRQRGCSEANCRRYATRIIEMKNQNGVACLKSGRGACTGNAKGLKLAPGQAVTIIQLASETPSRRLKRISPPGSSRCCESIPGD